MQPTGQRTGYPGLQQTSENDGTSFCNVCFNFDWDVLQLNREFEARITQTLHHPCSTLFSAADNGCYTCEVLRTALESLYNVEDPSKVMFEISLKNRRGHVTDQAWSLVPKLHVWTPQDLGRSETIDLYRTNDDNCPWELFQVNHHVPESTASAASFSWAQIQLGRCVARHPGCRTKSRAIPLLPTRVIDVGLASASDDTVKVIETNGGRGHYMALSHCWGNVAKMATKLTAHTLRAYNDHISFSDLPRTFQDAVTFVRRMNMRYLWIDSLCIIQEDPSRDSPQDRELSRQDWMRESGMMCSVFQNSHLTLAAASATDCTGGLFFGQKTIDVEINDHNELSHLYARREIDHHASAFPLLQRGWVTQEIVLSPRTLFFGADELLWHCRGHTACQCSPSNTKSSNWAHFTKLPRPPESPSIPIRLVEKWHELVESYSMTSLSYPADRLTAIDGIAQYMRPLRRGEYIAGIWDDSLGSDLLWRAKGFGSHTKRTVQRHPPGITQWSSKQRLFPTWSWASIQGRVIWWDIDDFMKDSAAGTFLITRVHDYQPGLASPAYELKLRGVLVYTSLGILRTPLNDQITFFPDCDNQRLSSATVVACLRVFQSGEDYRSIALVNVGREGETVYERIGLLKFRGNPKRRVRLPTFSGEPMVRGLPMWWQNAGGWMPEQTVVRIV